uniref:P3a n=1 Tax=Turnip yellows virus TaxID=131083 RepID=A0A897THP1_9VIRU|nr:P3a [Turnip yellows virus]
MDYKFIAGCSTGFLLRIPVSSLELLLMYVRISTHLRSIVNEYGRG